MKNRDNFMETQTRIHNTEEKKTDTRSFPGSKSDAFLIHTSNIQNLHMHTHNSISIIIWQVS